jgi:hypothetical protein
VPHRYVLVDAARLLLILARFSTKASPGSGADRVLPARPVVRHFSPEYYLQKLDFLVRYPGYFVYELVAFYKAGAPAARNRDEMITLIRSVVDDREPDRLTLPYRRFWRGAYERLDDVEAWWHSRSLVYTCQQTRGQARPQKHYFLTERAIVEASRLIEEVPHARWYANRIEQLYRFFGHLPPAQVKNLQYRHPEYRDAQLREEIPDLTPQAIRDAFADAFCEQLEGDLD